MSQLDWPLGFERTSESERSTNSRYEVNFRRSRRKLDDQMRLMGVDHHRLEHVKGRGGDPGVALYWTKDGNDRAVAVDAYAKKADNLRELVLWIEEMRKADNRDVKTGSDTFAAAALPSGDAEAIEPTVDPYESLPVDRSASDELKKVAADEYMKASHPDNGGSSAQFQHAQRVREAIAEEVGDGE